MVQPLLRLCLRVCVQLSAKLSAPLKNKESMAETITIYEVNMLDSCMYGHWFLQYVSVQHM